MNPVNGKPTSTQLTPEKEAHLEVLRAAEKEKADAALAAIKAKAAQNPEQLREMLLELDNSKGNSIGTWSTDEIEKYVREVNPHLVDSLISPEDPLSEDEYQLRIENELVKTIRKRNITHHTAPEKAQSVYYALRNAQQAKDLRKEGKIKEAEQRELAAKQRWETARATSETEKPFRFAGKGAYGSVESVVPGEAGPIIMKKSLPGKTTHTQKHAHALEAKFVYDLNHPNIIRVIPAKNSAPEATSTSSPGVTGKYDSNSSQMAIMGRITNVCNGSYSSDEYAGVSAEIEQIWAGTDFNDDGIDFLRLVVNEKLAQVRNEKAIEFLNGLQQLFQTPKAEQSKSEPASAESTAVQSQSTESPFLSDDPQLDQSVSDQSESPFPMTTMTKFYLEAGGMPATALINGMQDRKTMLRGVNHTANNFEGKDTATLATEVRKLMMNIGSDKDSASHYDAELARIEQIWINTDFSDKYVEGFLSLINNDLLKWHKSDKANEYLNTLVKLFETPKVKPVWKPAGGPLPMENVHSIASQLFDAVHYLHKQDIVHRDIKTDNVLIQPDGTVNLIDFGFSAKLEQVKISREAAGTPYYMAPEAINLRFHNGKYPSGCSEKADVFSSGCFLCRLLTGKHYNEILNDGKKSMKTLMAQAVDKKDRLQQDMNNNIDDQYRENQQQAEQLKDLLAKMLEPYPEKRISMEQALKHPFFQQQEKMADEPVTARNTGPGITSGG